MLSNFPHWRHARRLLTLCSLALLSVALIPPTCVTLGAEAPPPPVTQPTQPAPAPPSPPTTAAPDFHNAGTLRFAQISDVHLFDAGYKCSGEYVEREYQENLNALRWSIDEINRRWKSGDQIDFLVFTGDLGIANLTGAPREQKAPDSNSPCSRPGDPASSYGPIAQMDFPTAEALLAKLIDCLPTNVPVYFLPGNNDLTDEDPTTLSRYVQFLSGLRTLTHGRVVDLNEQAIKVRGYTLVGLNSAGFKPQKFSNPSGSVDESIVMTRGKTASPSGGFYCDELKNGASERADEKTKAITTLSSLTSGTGPYLVFTHIPDLPDPFVGRRLSMGASGGVCEYRSSWLLTQDARKAWMTSGLDSPKVVALFAGHFHADNPAKYGGPLANDAVKAIYTDEKNTPVRTNGLVPQFVTPPLAVKLQWENYPNGARGMMFVSVLNGVVSTQIDPYWSILASDCCGEAHPDWWTTWIKVLREHPGYSFLIAFVFTLILIVLVLLLAGELDPTCKSAAENRRWRIEWLQRRAFCVKHTILKLVLDKETDTYSLSKMQFVLWTFASIYGYVYLWIAHTWIQGLPGLPDIADQFPWEQSLSAGTAIATQISQRTVGTKGGGPLGPQLSDLISAGGVIAPGRLQFFSWTLIAIGGYLGSILASDPCIAHALPTIPPNLLLVSGLSSVAYLAARGVSAPGPVISSAQYAKNDTPPLVGDPISNTGTLTLLGSGFSKLAKIELRVDNPPDKTVTDKTPGDIKVAPGPYDIDPNFAVPGNPDYATKLIVGIDGDTSQKPYPYIVRVTNPDGKFGEAKLLFPNKTDTN